MPRINRTIHPILENAFNRGCMRFLLEELLPSTGVKVDMNGGRVVNVRVFRVVT